MREQHGKHNVLERAEGREQVKRLEDIANMLRPEAIALRLRQGKNLRVIDPDSPCRRHCNTSDKIKQRCFARTAWSLQDGIATCWQRQLLDVKHLQVAAMTQRKGLFHSMQSHCDPCTCHVAVQGALRQGRHT